MLFCKDWWASCISRLEKPSRADTRRTSSSCRRARRRIPRKLKQVSLRWRWWSYLKHMQAAVTTAGENLFRSCSRHEISITKRALVVICAVRSWLKRIRVINGAKMSILLVQETFQLNWHNMEISRSRISDAVVVWSVAATHFLTWIGFTSKTKK